jgi:6-phospho-3-hexuloisomerase
MAVAKRLNHLGVAAFCVGDTNEPPIAERDVLIAASGSGESVWPVAIAEKAKEHGARVIHIGSNPHWSLSSESDLFIRIAAPTKLHLPDEINSSQIMSSLFEQSLYNFCDAVCLMIVSNRELCMEEMESRYANLE